MIRLMRRNARGYWVLSFLPVSVVCPRRFLLIAFLNFRKDRAYYGRI
jgi:hypothetical protein